MTPSDGTAALFAQLERMSVATVWRDGMKEGKEAELVTHSWIKCDIGARKSGALSPHRFQKANYNQAAEKKQNILLSLFTECVHVNPNSTEFIMNLTFDCTELYWFLYVRRLVSTKRWVSAWFLFILFLTMTSATFDSKQWFEGQESGGQKLLLVIWQANLLSIYISRPRRGEPGPLASTPVCMECRSFVTLAVGAIMKNNNKPLLEKSANERNTPEALWWLLLSQIQPVGRPFRHTFMHVPHRRPD